jgi:hypothetical protein
MPNITQFNGDIVTGQAPTQNFMSWALGVFQVVFACSQSGATSARPSTGLWVGRPYFDTTLNKPIWVQSTSPVIWQDATGTAV